MLINVKGLGGPYLEHDFPSGSDEIMNGTRAEERMEFEIFSRFNAMGPRA